ncbi:DUF1772 domain-containing protein [Kineococcus rhizosphaerae]|uniref:Uncharacterized protein DUF1772 n=1 Tax=Kineococcus rhizosphaerae TaxID=559628 RepID=A0A2T0QYE3_9ACTN|nr:DUF1772 domain-containing protein [Kineococcus rhizosphaerae]PRY11402.1 uncharacterized protein DUF1772 [Kineococcus rhizosphaerae]
MSTVLLVVSAAGVVLLGLSAGVHLSGLAALNPTLRDVDSRSYVTVKQSADRHFEPFMRPLTLSGLVALLAQTLLAALGGRTAVAVVAGSALVVAGAALVAVLRGDLPINRRMSGWRPEAPPADWTVWRGRWERFFLVRTVATVLAFLAALAALLLVR